MKQFSKDRTDNIYCPTKMKEIRKRSALTKEVEQILKEQKLENYHKGVVDKLSSVVEKMVLKTLKDANFLKQPGAEINKSDILMAIALENENQKEVGPLDTESLIDLADDYNTKSLAVKDTDGLKIPKDNLGNCNYQLENPKKKMKLEAALKLDNKQLGNCFTFYIPPKHYKPSNMGGFMIKNTKDVPMKITIRPKFNSSQQTVSMLKSNNNH